ncbi:MAG TPA: AI-2E family transporter [Baekduia sp.]|nr:AI-2E family transporter [Baekduia sp.]
MPHVRVRRPTSPAEPDGAPAPLAPRDLTALFTTPAWLRDLGTSAWLVVGVTLLLVGMVWLLSLTSTIVLPVITAGVVASVASPLVGWMERHGIPRGAGAALVLVAVAVLGVGVVVLVVAGITSQAGTLGDTLSSARDTAGTWLTDLGVDQGSADKAKHDLSSAVGDAVPQLLHGVGHALTSLSSLAVFLAFTALSLFFLLKDSHLIGAWAERHMRVPPPVAHRMSGRLLQSMRGYFLGVTVVACFNGVVVLVGALILGVPLAGTIAAVTFLGAYIPYLGAWGAGAFAVAVALGGAGTDAAIGMAVLQLLANGILQQLVQPIAYGAALGIHPLAVLIVTIAGGSLFGAVGLILAAPLTSAATRIASDLAAGAAEPAPAADTRPPPPVPHAGAAL